MKVGGAPPQRSGPGGLGGFGRPSVGLGSCIGLFGLGLRLADDDLGAVEREIVERHVEALAVAMRPYGSRSGASTTGYGPSSRRKHDGSGDWLSARGASPGSRQALPAPAQTARNNEGPSTAARAVHYG